MKQKVLNGVKKKKIPCGVKYIIHSREGSGKRRLDGPLQGKDERTVWKVNLDMPAMLLCSVSLKVLTRRESLLSLKPFFAFIALSHHCSCAAESLGPKHKVGTSCPGLPICHSPGSRKCRGPLATDDTPARANKQQNV